MRQRQTKLRPRAGRFVTFPEPIDQWIDSKISAGTYRTAAEFLVKIARDVYEREQAQAPEREGEQAVA